MRSDSCQLLNTSIQVDQFLLTILLKNGAAFNGDKNIIVLYCITLAESEIWRLTGLAIDVSSFGKSAHFIMLMFQNMRNIRFSIGYCLRGCTECDARKVQGIPLLQRWSYI